MSGRQRRELFRAPGVEGTGADQDRTDIMLLRESSEGRFEIAIGFGIHNKELQAQHARRRLQFCDGGLGSRKGRVGEDAEQGNMGHQLVEQLQSFRRQFGR
jgi:hypothetical protein